MPEVTDSDGRKRLRLETWGEIATHLGVEIRTAQRWEDQHGLPVHRLTGSQAVFAYADEIADWQASQEVQKSNGKAAANAGEAARGDELPGVEAARLDVATGEPEATEEPARTPPQPAADAAAPPGSSAPVPAPAPRAPIAWNEWALAATAIAVVVLVGYLALQPRTLDPVVTRDASPAGPSELVLQGQRLVALGPAEAALWSYDFGEPATLINAPNRPDMQPWWTRMDVDADGAEELVVVVGHPRNTDLPTETLYCLTLNGRLRYRYTPEFVLEFARARYTGPWYFWDIEPVAEDHSVWVALAHHTWWPSAVVRLGADGAAAFRYIQPGHVRLLRSLRREGRTLVLAGGVNNEYGSASLAVLDVRGEPAAAPQEREGSYACRGCPPGRPLRYVLFPPTFMNAADGLPYNRVARIVAGTDGVEISTDETDKIPMFYALGPDWRVTSAMPGDGYLSWRPSRPWAGPTTLAPSATVRIWAGGAWSEQQVPYGLPQGGALPSIRPAGRQAPPPGPRDVLEPSAAR